MELERTIDISNIQLRVEKFGTPGNREDEEGRWAYQVYVGNFLMGFAFARIVDNHYELLWEYRWNDRGSVNNRESIGIVDMDKPEEADTRLRKALDEKIQDIVGYMRMTE